MKIGIAQTNPVKGDVESNIARHKKLISLAIANGVAMIFFPELSLTGYEPTLAAALSSTFDDRRFDAFKKISDTNEITIAVGMPLKDSIGIQIGMIIFEPHQQPHTYSKQYLHPDEYPYFVKGADQLLLADNRLAIAICYELSVPQHIALAYKNGARCYVASVAKSIHGVEKATEQLAGIAKRYAIPVMMSNCIGHCDDFDCGGKSSAWNEKGELVAQLNGSNEGILIMDTITHEVIIKII